MNYRHTRIRYTASGSPSGRGGLFDSLRARAAGPIGRVLAVVAGSLVLVAALFVSAVVFSVLLVVGAVAGGWFWWKTRGLRREIRERLAQMQQMQSGQGPGASAGWEPSPRAAEAARRADDIIDGDFVREKESRSG
jgi:hypothetical protein